MTRDSYDILIAYVQPSYPDRHYLYLSADYR